MRLTVFAQIKEGLGAKLSFFEKLAIHPYFEKFFDAYYNVTAFIEWCKRAIAYARVGYKNYDFDALSIENYLLFKLKRVERCLVNGTCDLTVEMGPKKMKAIRLCIKLLTRLTDGSYHRFLDMHHAKWGVGEMTFTKVEGTENKPGGPYSTMDIVYAKANTPELKAQQRKEYMEAVYADDREESRDRRLVYAIIQKYITYWWD